jgi:DNA-binding LacI/PurR family transcriptional regulator
MARRRSGITQAEIATMYGISQSLVSRVLSNVDDRSFCTEEQRLRILDAARDLKYQFSRSARRFLEGRAGSIGVIAPSLHHVPQGGMSALSREFRAARWAIFLEEFGTDDNQETCLAQNAVECSILFSAEQFPNIVAEFRKSLHPFLLVNSPDTAGPSLLWSDTKAIQRVVDQIARDGRRHVVLMGGTPEFEGYAKPRFDAFLAFGTAAGLRMSIQNGFTDDQRTIHKLTAMFDADDVPDVLISLNSLQVPPIYQAAAEHGLRIPADLGIVAFTFSPVVNIMRPAIDVISIDVTEVARRCLARVRSLIRGDDTGETELIHAYWQQNGSLRKQR